MSYLPRNRISQRKALLNLLSHHERSLFGQHYQFSEIGDTTVELEFTSLVPLFDYELIHAKWWSKYFQGYENVTQVGELRYFSLSSGTSGAPSKYIPVSDKSIQFLHTQYRRMYSEAFFKTLPMNARFKKGLGVGGSSALVNTAGYRVGDLSGIIAGERPKFISRLYLPGQEITELPDWASRVESISENASKWDVGIIAGIPSWIKLLLETIIRNNGEGHIKELWRNLEVIVSGGVHLEPYIPLINELVGKELRYLNTYLTSEGFIAYSSDYKKGMSLILDGSIYYEFIPYSEYQEELSKNEAIPLSQVKPGVPYVLVISTHSGIWRYVIGDVVLFEDIGNYTIQIVGRITNYLNACGEHVTQSNLTAAINAVSWELSLPIHNYTVGISRDNGNFIHEWYIGISNKSVACGSVKNIIDQTLCRVNDDYSIERSAMLGMEVHCIPNERFTEYMAVKGKIGAQYKFPIVQKEEGFNNWKLYNQRRE